ncbi:uncharacterized protein BO80DRAFT_488071 [Aspergillus ibericus CBS 121593]|uniref:Uncharacterized protein n=1 Tax=Aspergillus ibericus CBS 121593 TaxID=1448316 RepID=A0A395GI54_9EURO|nr:hypothetical protein BO80DRAFT_488071 [Aspergillus ibericus CBS 121593]RAK95115.1 hypothetical protein BO80DRAFT_488071 [Aspergillus ibericus CBS 121593]
MRREDCKKEEKRREEKKESKKKEDERKMEDDPEKEQFIGTSAVAKVLDEAQIPYVIWGGVMYVLMHVRKGCSKLEITFVIPDEYLSEAVQALRAAGYSDRNAWDWSCFWDRPHESIRGAYTWPAHPFEPKKGLTFHNPIGLLRKSQWLSSFPDPPVGFPRDDDPNFMLTTDCRLMDWGTPGWASDFYPVKMLKPVPWVESLILQEVRDWTLKKSVGVGWPWLQAIEQFHRNSARLLPRELFSPHCIRQPFGTIYERLMVVDDDRVTCREINPLLDQIWEDMRAKGTLPDPMFECVDPGFKECLEFRKQLRGLSGEEIEERFGENAAD